MHVHMSLNLLAPACDTPQRCLHTVFPSGLPFCNSVAIDLDQVLLPHPDNMGYKFLYPFITFTIKTNSHTGRMGKLCTNECVHRIECKELASMIMSLEIRSRKINSHTAHCVSS